MALKEKFQNKERLTLFLIILLLNLFSFGLGFIVGSKIFFPNPIIINGVSF
jgi:hypothetical protein